MLQLPWNKVITARKTCVDVQPDGTATVVYSGSLIFTVRLDNTVVVNPSHCERSEGLRGRLNECLRYFESPYQIRNVGKEPGWWAIPNTEGESIRYEAGMTLPIIPTSPTTTETEQTANRWQTWLASHNWKSFMSPAQTVIEVMPNGDMTFRYHGRTLVTARPDGTLTLDIPDDARTEPTRKRINSFLRYIESVYSVVGSHDNPKDWSVASSSDKLCFKALINGMTLSA